MFLQLELKVLTDQTDQSRLENLLLLPDPVSIATSLSAPTLAHRTWNLAVIDTSDLHLPRRDRCSLTVFGQLRNACRAGLWCIPVNLVFWHDQLLHMEGRIPANVMFIIGGDETPKKSSSTSSAPRPVRLILSRPPMETEGIDSQVPPGKVGPKTNTKGSGTLSLHDLVNFSKLLATSGAEGNDGVLHG
ncbi:hypothetical protein FGIG_05868 [Fasciola gigantica]|uniref:Uncharacterized protein n=1 Tax=Fasciola gigantica TaxID=46835 RepID=A0A504YZD5_FASGI|nr:hypothetical protein FGIG_05868 [Fasciola gigantica]